MEEEIKENQAEKKFEGGFSADSGRSPVCVLPFMSLGWAGQCSANLNSSVVEV